MMLLQELITPSVKRNVPAKRFDQPSLQHSSTLRHIVSNKSSDSHYKQKNPHLLIHGPKNTPIEQIGQGAFGSVFSHKNRPNSVIKVGRAYEADNQRDGYLNYIESILINDRMSSNPYFPRVYNLKTYKNGSYVIEVEKLQRLDQFDIEMLHAAGRQMFTHWPETNQMDSFNAARRISEMIWDALTHTNYVKDEQLKQALYLIKLIHRTKKAGLDINSNNVMGRQTSYGLQVVLSDPLA